MDNGTTKKLLIALAVIMLLGAFTGCGSPAVSASAAADESAAATMQTTQTQEGSQEESDYQKASSYIEQNDLINAIGLLRGLGEYKDSQELLRKYSVIFLADYIFKNGEKTDEDLSIEDSDTTPEEGYALTESDMTFLLNQHPMDMSMLNFRSINRSMKYKM